MVLGAVVGAGLLVGTGSGGVTDWTGALISLVGLALAGLGAGYAYTSLMDSRRRDGEVRIAQRRAQAEKVKGWGGEAVWRASTPTTVVLEPGRAQVTTHGEGPILLEWCDLSAHNASDMPVSGFEFEFLVREAGSDAPYIQAGCYSIGVLMPGQHEIRFEPEPQSDLLKTMADAVRTITGNNINPPQFAIGYAFTHHNGVRWKWKRSTRRVEEADS